MRSSKIMNVLATALSIVMIVSACSVKTVEDTNVDPKVEKTTVQEEAVGDRTSQNQSDEEAEKPPTPEERGPLKIQSLEDIDEAIMAMTLQEKAGQLIQAERSGIQLSEISLYNIGSILSGGGSVPKDNSPKGWTTLTNRMQKVSRNSTSGIPLIYGIDAVHGNNNLAGATIFPHNIGLGAANDPELMEAIGRATAKEVQAIGVHWNFAPAVSCVQDLRWGRAYESYSEDIQRVSKLSVPYIIGLQDEGVMATTKHFIGDGQTEYGTGPGDHILDRGDVTVSMESMKEVNYPAYEAAINAGTASIMASYNSINRTQVHGSKDLLTDMLRVELGFEGLVVSDWEAIRAVAPDLKSQVAIAVNAGVDLLMEPWSWKDVYKYIIENVEEGIISEERLDEAVRRNLVFKYEAGLFTEDYEKEPGEIRTEEHKSIAREAVAKSLVLLENDGILPLQKNASINLIGPASDNVGIQSGGWTRQWQGEMEADQNDGISLRDAFESVLTANGGKLTNSASEADVVVVAIGEKPYSEMKGDSWDLSLEGPQALEGNLEALEEAKKSGKPVITVMIAGRPMLVDEHVGNWDAFVMAWLPGTEGDGMTDVLFGDVDFTGTLPVTWPKVNDQASHSVMTTVDYVSIDHQYKYDYRFGQ